MITNDEVLLMVKTTEVLDIREGDKVLGAPEVVKLSVSKVVEMSK